MLTERFVASTINPEKSDSASTLGVHVHDFQPIPKLISTYKKSSCNINCLAVNSTHIFAAQADKAVIHVYSREKGNQESTVPFPEKICCIALAGEQDGAGVLILGTDSGRIILWELATGRQVSTPQHHLQATICLAVDLNSNFLLSGSIDSNIHVWNILGLLSFSAPTDDQSDQHLPLSPLRSFSSHRTAITAVAFGHSTTKNNFAVSTSKDKTCVVWDYLTCAILQTFLLPETPLCLALDPVDRAAYVGYEDGSVHFIDLYKERGLSQQLYGSSGQETLSEPPLSDRWRLQEDASGSAILCIQVSYDGTTLLSGHQDGKIHSWDVGKARYAHRLVDFSAPLTNLSFLPLTAFPHDAQTSGVKLNQIIKPRYGGFVNSASADTDSAVPTSYTFTARFMTDLSSLNPQSGTQFHASLSHASFPISLLNQTAACFSSSESKGIGGHGPELAKVQAQNISISAQLSDIKAREHERDRQEEKQKQEMEIKAARKKRRRMRQTKMNETMRKRHMGETVENGDAGLAKERTEEEQDLSDSTDEMSDSD